MDSHLDLRAAEFLQSAISKGYTARDVVTDPEAIANALGVHLSNAQRSGIQRLNSPDLHKRLTSLSPGAHIYMREVIKDGRYLSDWKNNPSEVGLRLGLILDPAVEGEIEQFDLDDVISPRDSGTTLRVASATVISVAVAVIVAASGHLDGDEDPIIDFSKIEKL